MTGGPALPAGAWKPGRASRYTGRVPEVLALVVAWPLLLSLLSPGVALAQAPPAPRPPDVSITSIGSQTWTSSALGLTDVDLILGQRLRWTLAGDREGPDNLLALVDARFTVDPGGGPPFEWSQVRQLGAELNQGRWTLDVGRHPVFRGGPRLVDGFQGLVRASDTVTVGAWGGLAPDLFTTLPELRPGFGPIFAWIRSRTQLSVVGEVLLFDGALDRVGVLTQARASANRTVEVSGRLDVEVVGPLGARLVDGQIGSTLMPLEAVRIDLLYDAFSSYRYVGSDTLDPDLQRFAQRMQALGLALGIVEDVRDPTLNHLVGAGARWQPDTGGAAPRVALNTRYRYHPEAVNRYTRINPQAGVVSIAERLDVLADANLIQTFDPAVLGTPGAPVVDDAVPGTQIDAGLLLFVEPDPDGPISFDASFRALMAKDALAAPGLYGDLFVNAVVVPADLVFIAGISVMTEPDVEQQDNGFGAFVRVAKYLRP